VSVATIFGLCAAVLIGIGVYGLIVVAHPLRKIMAFNIIGSGVFILFGATALAVALVVRLIEATGSASLSSETAAAPAGDTAPESSTAP
jgi:multicomponent Na+:H+ antiporter subunit C